MSLDQVGLGVLWTPAVDQLLGGVVPGICHQGPGDVTEILAPLQFLDRLAHLILPVAIDNCVTVPGVERRRTLVVFAWASALPFYPRRPVSVYFVTNTVWTANGKRVLRAPVGIEDVGLFESALFVRVQSGC